MPSYALYRTSYPHFMTTILSIYDITCTVFMTSHAIYMTCHLLCVISYSLYVWLLTMTVLCHHTLYIYDISTLYGITHSVRTTQPLCTSQPLCLISHPMYQFYQTQCMYDITSTICMKSYVICMTSHPLFMTSQHFLWHQVHYIWHHIH